MWTVPSPYGLPVERLLEGLSANQHGLSGVLPSNGSLELVCAHVQEPEPAG